MSKFGTSFMRRSVIAAIGGAAILLSGSILGAGAQAAPTRSHTLSANSLCRHFGNYHDTCHSGTVARAGKIFHYEYNTGYAYHRHWMTLHASRSTCTSITLTWTGKIKRHADRTTITIVTDSGSKKATVHGGKLGTVSAKLTGTHAFIVKGYDSQEDGMYVSGQATCRTSSGR